MSKSGHSEYLNLVFVLSHHMKIVFTPAWKGLPAGWTPNVNVDTWINLLYKFLSQNSGVSRVEMGDECVHGKEFSLLRTDDTTFFRALLMVFLVLLSEWPVFVQIPLDLAEFLVQFVQNLATLPCILCQDFPSRFSSVPSKSGWFWRAPWWFQAFRCDCRSPKGKAIAAWYQSDQIFD